MEDEVLSPIVNGDDDHQERQEQEQLLAASSSEDDYGWATHWDESANAHTSDNNGGGDNNETVSLIVDALPPQLHPAVSLGLQRVSSCAYFSTYGNNTTTSMGAGGCGSAVSEADMFSLQSSHHAFEFMSTATASLCGNDDDTSDPDATSAQADWLYHDVIMYVFTFLDAKSLAAFSETARRMNYEIFYFLQLQLQRALLEDNLKFPMTTTQNNSLPLSQDANNSNNNDRLAAIAGSWTISRLASMDKQEANDVVQEYLDSNCTLRTMPLSHSLAYIRQVLRRNGFPGGYYNSNTTGVAGGGQQHPQQTQSLTTSAAVLIGLMGAAAVMSGNVDVEAVESFGTELPNMLFKVGFVGSLMGAARHGWEAQQNKARQQEEDDEGEQDDNNNQDNQEDDGNSSTTNSGDNNHTNLRLRETAEQMARSIQEMLQHVRMTAVQVSSSSQQTHHQHQEQQAQQPQQARQQQDSQQQQQQQQQQEEDGFFSRRMYDAFLAAASSSCSNSANNNNDGNAQQSIPEEEEEEEEEIFGTIQGPWSPNPYEHLPPRHATEAEGEEKVDEYSNNDDSNDQTATNTMTLGRFQVPIAAVARIMMMSTASSPRGGGRRRTPLNNKMPSGCVGAYFRAIRRASKSIRELVQKDRRNRFEALPNKEEVARTFIDACCSDDSLDVVKDLVQHKSIIDASGFFVGSDGTETCALHASAFHGATTVLQFLCGGIDERDPTKDEGLCSVDLQDVNGWTALHFAAGANCVESARILAERGANLAVVAENGYTPLQWAQRLSNHEVAEEIRIRLEQTDPYHQASNHRWISGASQPLSMIAHRFFAMIPTH